MASKRSNRAVPTDPPLPPPVYVAQEPASKLWTKWFIMHSNEDVCNAVSMAFPGWTIMIVGADKPNAYR